ncbi:4-hydroxy-tetrahydrodipicolinate reductase [Candidatus Cyanaurora vandensis]|uniref:4-hydroxy-tetrahydrodipicolinate reductase n=1 Tax=Candidatus Cyanaurora vandensis TaxID=2714958 RepID=UPI0037BEEA72
MGRMKPIPVVVVGAAGKMGRVVVKGIQAAPDLELVGAVDVSHLDEDAGVLAGCGEIEVPITADLKTSLMMCAQEREPGVMVDFTHPATVYDNIREGVAFGLRVVVGTTGLSPAQLNELSEFCEKASTGCIVAPNFALGMVLLQQACARMAQYFDHVEIIEQHHNQKADAPSGTALKTAHMMAGLGKTFNLTEVDEAELLTGARGATGEDGIRIHSVRLPGLIAHQEVIFGGPGQILTLRHDTTDREAYVPGVLLAIRKVRQYKNLVYGLEKIL